MGKFSDYVGSINEQTEMLRQNLTYATGEDCSKMSIGSCANVIASKLPDSFEDEDDGSYVRPEWYPDPKEILNTAPDIVVNGTTYYPAYIMLMNNYEDETAFYKTHSTSSSAVNFWKGTGGDAVLCSDRCDNDIANASAETLEIGTTIMHTWDLSKDIEDPSGKADYKIRWVIIYIISKTNYIQIQINKFNAIELITGNIFLSDTSFNTSNGNYYCEYIELQQNTNYSGVPAGVQAFSYMSSLKEIKINNEMKEILNGSSFSYCFRLSKITLPNSLSNLSANINNIYSLKTIITPKNIEKIGSPQLLFINNASIKYLTVPSFDLGGSAYSLSNMYSLKKVVFEEGVKTLSTSTSGDSAPFYKCYNLEEIIFPSTMDGISLPTMLPKIKQIKIPSSITKLNVAGLIGATYIELFKDFNISGVNFNPQYAVAKSLQWLKDLCIWLKDRTGETSNTMKIGAENIKNAQRLWLTFNPNDKRDITWVDAGTEGAINIVEFITSELNWSLS